MSKVNYFSKKPIKNYDCQNMECSWELPPYDLTEEERKFLGVGLSLEEWRIFWRNNNCEYIVENMLYNSGIYSEDGFRKAVSFYNYIFYSYFGPYDSQRNKKGGHIISDSDEMSNLLINSCLKNQGVCQCVAHTMCYECTSMSIHDSKLLRKLGGCACIPKTSIKYNLPQECDSECTGINVSKKRDYSTGKIKECKRKVCFIDPLTGLVFDEQCSHCKQGECVCITDRRGYFVKEKCGNIQKNKKQTKPNIFVFIFLLIIVLVSALFFVIFYDKSIPKEEDKILFTSENIYFRDYNYDDENNG